MEHFVCVYIMNYDPFSSAGPFLLSSVGERTLYWSVDDTNYTVHATTNISNASLFFIIPNDEGSYAYEFHIAYKGDNPRVLKKQVSSLTLKSHRQIEPIPRYFSAPVSTFGANPGPLQLKHHVFDGSRLLLENRIGEDKAPVNPQNWINGREVFFIRCARRKLRRDGYVCVKQRRRRANDEWITACVPSKFLHNGQDIFMLFQLLPASYREQQSQDMPAKHTEDIPLEDPKHNLDQELENLGRGSAPERFRAPLGKRKSTKIRLPTDSEDAQRLTTNPNESKPLAQVRFDTSGGTISDTHDSVPLLHLHSHPTADPGINTRDTTL